MNILFEDDGLVFISSNDPRLKRLLSPLFTREISEYPKISQMVITQSAELEKNYHAQVKAKSINLFLFHKGGRYLIEPREHDFSLKGTRHFLQKDELLKIAQETPELLSTNVILRPVAQDTLLPTVAYVGGPSEIAYHAQLGPIYDYTGVVQPVIYPRASCTLIEERLRKTMEKYSLELMMFFGDINKLTSHVLEQIADVRLDAIFTNTGKHVNEALNELKFGLKEIDPTLLGALDGVASKIDSHLANLKEKSVVAQKRKNEIAVRQLEKSARSVLPNGNLQEREVNVVHYMNRHGFDIVKWMASQIDINGFKHQLLPLR
jgi:bacillithiol biosynthesis cysteine-adding enzyme BshC